ncbi:hypothetical protein AB0I84_50700, partial [Streptomyces spectabilis]
GRCGRGGGRAAVTLTGFAAAAGEGLRVTAAPAVPGAVPAGLGLPELAAEAALLQARLDWFQSELGRLRKAD